MSTAAPAVASARPSERFAVRLFGVGAVVFLANFGLLVLQLLAGRLLSPFIGSSLETWTAVIAAFLTGIALGNFLGGRMAERVPSVGRLAGVLLAGVVGTLWMAAFPMLLNATALHEPLPMGVRIPVLSFALCLPVATVLSLLTPLAIRFGVPDVTRTGQVAGTVFALSTLGCLLGNYLTGFVLIPAMTVNVIVYAVAGLLAIVGGAAMLLGRGEVGTAPDSSPRPEPEAKRDPNARAPLPLIVGFAVVFLCSFAGMALEMAASRVIAAQVGVSLFTWTGVIGVMLAGTCVGNWLGGKLGDRAHQGRAEDRPQFALAAALLTASVFAVLILILFSTVSEFHVAGWGIIERVVFLTFGLFFAPMALLGTISPQVIRLCVSDTKSAGKTAGRVYAVSTMGAIVGTFAAGHVLIAAVGWRGTILLAAVLVGGAAALLVRVWKHPAMLYVMSAVGGAFLGGTVLLFQRTDARGEVTTETNYYTITVHRMGRERPVGLEVAVGGMPLPSSDRFAKLYLDHLLHSEVNLDNPRHFHYRHEQVQLEAVYAAEARSPAAQKVLVIGGGGYTFPRAVRTLLPTAAVDVVEIDPGVTKMAYQELELDPALKINSFHRDGRQFVAEAAAPNSYDVVSLDAVNDFAVPAHLLTRECNEAVKRTLTKDGAYLVTVIDLVKDGKLWKAAYHTLKKSFTHVYFTLSRKDVEDRRGSSSAYRAAAARLGRPVVNDDEVIVRDLSRLAAVKRLGRPITSDLELEEDDAVYGRAYRATGDACRAAAVRLGRATVEDREVTLEDAVRGLDRTVIVLYATDTPLDAAALDALVRKRTREASDVFVLSDAVAAELLGDAKELILTDQYAPVDNLMATVFLRRAEQ